MNVYWQLMLSVRTVCNLGCGCTHPVLCVYVNTRAHSCCTVWRIVVLVGSCVAGLLQRLPWTPFCGKHFVLHICALSLFQLCACLAMHSLNNIKWPLIEIMQETHYIVGTCLIIKLCIIIIIIMYHIIVWLKSYVSSNSYAVVTRFTKCSFVSVKEFLL